MSELDVFPPQEQETRSNSRSFGFSFLIRTLTSHFHLQGEVHMSQQTMVPPRASRKTLQKAPLADILLSTEENEEEEVPRFPSSARRYSTPAALPHQTTSPLPAPAWDWQEIKQKSLQILLGVLLVGLAADTLGYTAWNAVSQHWHYGDYPTAHVSANFGHGGTSDLFAFTSGHEVEVLEVVGDKVSVYAAKLNTAERRLVTLERIDANGDGKMDMLVHIEGLSQTPCLLNTGKGFVWSVTR